MPVQISARIDQGTLLNLLNELTPLDIDLGEGEDHGRWLSIAPPEQLSLVAGVGVRLETSAKLTWRIASVSVPVTIQSIVLLLELSLAPPPSPGRVIARPRVESADLKGVPPSIDRRIVARINERLVVQPPAIGWTFAHTLSAALALPPQLTQLERFELTCADATLAISADAIDVGLALPMHFVRRSGPSLTQ